MTRSRLTLFIIALILFYFFYSGQIHSDQLRHIWLHFGSEYWNMYPFINWLLTGLIFWCQNCYFFSFAYIHKASYLVALTTSQPDLLEKARVIRQAPDERCFHIFYQLLASASPEMQEELILDQANSYRFLPNGLLEIPGSDERQSYRETTEAMNIMGITSEDQNGK